MAYWAVTTRPPDSTLTLESSVPRGIMRAALGSLAARADGWINVLTGIGGSNDRTEATHYGATFTPLGWNQLTAMYATEDLSAKIVDVYPREALRLGFQVGGLDDADQGDLQRFLTARMVTKRGVYLPLRAAIWGRLYGNAAAWLGSLTADPKTPLQPGEAVDFVRVVDDRYLRPAYLGSQYLDADGEPIWWNLVPPQGTQAGNGTFTIHESRLVFFGGAITDDHTRVSRGFRDLSVLQRPYNALRADGSVWKAAETLINEASVGVYKIKGLFGMVTSGQRDRLTERLRLANLGRTLNRSMVMDADKEDYTRIQQTFAGIPDLTDRAVKRVASAAEIPVTVLMGEAPAGLNATGDSDMRWFLARIQTYRTQQLEPLLERWVRILLAQPDSPWKARAAEATIVWPSLWEPTAPEKADMYSKTATADAIMLERGVLSPEEVRTRFTDDGYSCEIQTAELPDDTATPEDTNAAAAPAVLAGVVAQAVSGAIPKSAARTILALAVGEDQADEMLVDVDDAPPEPVTPPAGPSGEPAGSPPPPGNATPPKEPGTEAPAPGQSAQASGEEPGQGRASGD